MAVDEALVEPQDVDIVANIGSNANQNAKVMDPNYRRRSTNLISTSESASKQPQQLKSCLRQRRLSRGNLAEVRGGSVSASIHHQTPLEPSLQNQFQTRQDAQFSPRSAVSDPIVSRSTVAFAESPGYRSTSSASSSPTMETTRRSIYSSKNNCACSTAEDSERQFMRVTKSLVNRHMASISGNIPLSEMELLHRELPNFEQRLSYHNNLTRNVAYLPMFPDPNEHPSFAMTRYAEKTFGPILAREVKSASGKSIIGSNSPLSQQRDHQTMQYGRSRHQVHFLNANFQEPMFPSPLPQSPPYSNDPLVNFHNMRTKDVSIADVSSQPDQYSVHAQLESNSSTSIYGTSLNTAVPTLLQSHMSKKNIPEDPPISTASNSTTKRPPPISCQSLVGSSTDSNHDNSSSASSQDYQTLTTKEMLPPITPREKILYYPISTPTVGNSMVPCCNGGSARTRRNSSTMKKRPPSYHQLYVKCERSEPYINKDSDIVTWYRNADNRVMADRTLVVRNTTDVRDLIRGIAMSFGLTSLDKDVDCDSINGENSNLSLGCYKDICFVSDIKMTTCIETAETHLTPLPIPGFYYKYVDRNDNATSNQKRKGDLKSSSVLSSDMLGLRRTLVGQLLDKPIYSCSRSSSNQSEGTEGVRTRLALVLCTPKRNAFVSPRSTNHGVLPETIYHFQILLEGIVAEDDLPSSFQSQTAIRCVGATGGVVGGSIMDTQHEIDELNRTLWDGRDVIGLLSPRSNQQEKLEKIIDLLRIPLFDTEGNQTPKEFVVDRCLYNIYSGKLCMEVARTTQHTVEVIEDTAEWLAQGVDCISKSLTESAIACEDAYNEFENDFDSTVVSRYGKSSIRLI